MNLRESSHSIKAAVKRRESLLVAAGLFFALPAPGNADSFEDFMASKQKKERMANAAKNGEGVGEEEEDEVSKEEIAAAASTVDDDEEVGGGKTVKASKSYLDDYKDVKPIKDTDPLKTALVTVLRVQESTLQEARLITTGNFKDLQRNNIKMATRMMIENSKINDVIIKASAFTTDPTKVSEANEKGKAAVQDLTVILDYFDEQASAGKEVKVSELSKDKQKFILKALTSARDKLDSFLAYMPVAKVKEARNQVIFENDLNKKELPKDMEILNPVFMN